MKADAMSESKKEQDARERMVKDQLKRRDIIDRAVLEAMGTVPRHRFVPDDQRDYAYTDGPLRIGQGQTISQPYIVALMSQLLGLSGEETVLEIGTGSGYQAAVLGKLCKQVYSIERIPELAENARRTLLELSIPNVSVMVGDGSRGLPEQAPFEGIMVTAAAPSVPKPLLEQLTEGGRLVLPVGSQMGQSLECWTRDGEDYRCHHVAPVAFVPLVGEHGWSSDERSRWWR
jgi:protein-L-isoaspartate(D-aspartate) O-methyltransferase